MSHEMSREMLQKESRHVKESTQGSRTLLDSCLLDEAIGYVKTPQQTSENVELFKENVLDKV